MGNRRVVRQWHTNGIVTVHDALGELLDRLETLYDDEGPEPLPLDPLPLSTGMAALDRVLGGGIHLGSLTLLEAAEGGSAETVVSTVARHIALAALYAVPHVADATVWMLAGTASVPADAIRTGMLDETDWQTLSAAISDLADHHLAMTDTTSMSTLRAQVAVSKPTVVVVQAAERFGAGPLVVAQLAQLAASEGVAIVASIPTLGEHDEWFGARIQRVQVVAHDDADRVTLARPDALDMVCVASVDIEPLTRDVLAPTIDEAG